MTYNREKKPDVLAAIRESDCIGCTKCLDACPVDAIVGSQSLMHTVIASECIGCKLCLPPCPVDCIELIPTPDAYQRLSPDYLKQRYQTKRTRLANPKTEAFIPMNANHEQRKDYVLLALQRNSKK